MPHLAGLPAATTGASNGQALMNAWVLFGTIAVLLGLFFIFVLVLAVLRRRRRVSPKGGEGRTPTVDPWAEAGQRARPYPQRDRRR